jgi:hypothetical protein
MILEERRKEREKNLTVIAETQRDEFTYLVILRRESGMRDGKHNYFCHRYFLLRDSWEVSVDASHVDAETAMKWAWEPKALTPAGE